jgi:ABC-type polysaccharide/polyol phosphate transport system ATPase subunit
MNEIAVSFNQVTKRYFKGGRYQPTLREWLGTIVTGKSFQRPRFKALDKVSFTIQKGKVVGIIGSNGAGKSTILKLISRITYPNEGKIEINGSVAGLLELGTGFHSELTGRENVFLYASILGLRKNKIEQIYPKIVEFAGIEDFMGMPIKHYSSGMLARLGFAVAIHIEPDILLIDEVLAVGDIAFQKKCMEFMMNYCNDPNHTVVFVSHNTDHIKMICDKVIWIENGGIKKCSLTKIVLDKYILY